VIGSEFALSEEVQRLGVHLFPVVKIDKLGKFLIKGVSSKSSVEENPGRLTPRPRSSSSTSDTSHQLATRQRGPSNPGRIRRYDLNNAVSTICANRTSCSGVRDVKGAFG
jgi:hypothetical protein